MKLVSAVGSRLGAHATGLGKVLLAGLDPAELERRLDDGELTRYTERTITTRKALRAALAEIRERGYGEDEEEYAIGCRCIAMPLRDGNAQTVAALSVSVPTPRFDETVARRVRTSLSATVAALEAKIVGGT
jgi:IclR family KDG regulon transcriptional repressor